MRNQFPDYPCANRPHGQGNLVSSLTSLAKRPRGSASFLSQLAWASVEELSVGWIFVFTIFFGAWICVHPRLSCRKKVDCFLAESLVCVYHVLPLLSLVLPSREGCPSVLAYHLPQRGACVLSFAFGGTLFRVVASATAMALSMTILTTYLLYREGVPLHYSPVRVIAHMVMFSIAALALTESWDVMLRPRQLPLSALLHRLAKRLGLLGRLASDTAAAESTTGCDCGSVALASPMGADAAGQPAACGSVQRNSHGGAACEARERSRRLWTSLGERKTGRTRGPSAADVSALKRRLWPGLVLAQGRTPDPPPQPEWAAKRLRVAFFFQDPSPCRSPTISAVAVAAPCTGDAAKAPAGVQTLSSKEREPQGPWVRPAAQPQDSTNTCWVVASDSLPLQSVEPLVRRRFASQLGRAVLRIHIVGADPEQLPADWREIVFSHFGGDRPYSVSGPRGSLPMASQLVTGVAVRRGSIYMTVNLVQLPNHYDGGEGPGPAGAAGSAAPAAGGVAGQGTLAAAGGDVGRAEAPVAAPRVGPAGPRQQPEPRLEMLADGAGRFGGSGGFPASWVAAGAAAVLRGPYGYMPGRSSHLCDSGAEADAAAAPAGTSAARLYTRTGSTGWSHTPSIAGGPSSFDTSPPQIGAAVLAAAAGLTGLPPAGQRRRITGVWRAERHGALYSVSPSSTPGNSNNPLHILGPTVVNSGLSSGPQLSPGPAAVGFSMGLLNPGGASGGSRSMRYTPILSPAQHASICGAGGSSLDYYPNPCMPSGSSGPPGLAAGGTVGLVTTTQVAQLLDAMQLRTRAGEVGNAAGSGAAAAAAGTAAAASSREARHGCSVSVLSAVSQLDGSIPVRLRQVLATEGWELADGVSSSWEAEVVYERPAPPPALQHMSHLPAAGFPPGSANGHPAGAAAAAARQRLPGGVPYRVMPGSQPMASHGMILGPRGSSEPWGPAVLGPWPAPSGLAVHAGPAPLPVWEVAVKPVLICKAPLACPEAAGALAASIPPPPSAAASAATNTATVTAPGAAAAAATPPSETAATNAPAASASVNVAPGALSELHLSLMCAPGTVSELSVMLRYCGPASVFGEQTYLPVQLQLDSTSPAVAAAIRLQAAAADRDRRGGDTQAARDVAEGGEGATEPLPAHAIVRTTLAALACPGVLYVELWHGPQLCACLPVLLLPESAAAWAHEVCSLWQQQAEEADAASAAVASGQLASSRAGAAAVSAAGHQVVEDLGGWLTYAAHRRHVAELAATAAAAAAAVAASPAAVVAAAAAGHAALGPMSGGLDTVAASWTSRDSLAREAGLGDMHFLSQLPPLRQEELYPGWSWETASGETSMTTSPAHVHSVAGHVVTVSGLPPPVPPAAGTLYGAAASGGPFLDTRPGPITGVSSSYLLPYVPLATPNEALMNGGGSGAAAAASGAVGVGAYCNRELFHDMMLQEGYNWLADCVEAGCCGLATALMESLLAAGCSAVEVVRTCRSADGLPLMHTATLSGNTAMIELVWHWCQATGMDVGDWLPPSVRAVTLAAAAAEAEMYGDSEDEMGEPGAVDGWRTVVPPGASGIVKCDHGIGDAGAPAGLDAPAGSAAAAATAAAAKPTTARYASTSPSAGSARVSVLDSRNGIAAALRRLASGVANGRASVQAVAWRLITEVAARQVAWSPGAKRQTQRLVCVALGALALVPVAVGRVAAVLSAAVTATRTTAAQWRCVASRGGGLALRLGDWALNRTHATLLRVNVLHEAEGEEERRFMSYFQLHHGWAFSAWCWSMIPLYSLIVWRYLIEGEWGKLVLTPMWMWMYVLCAVADVAGCTAAYRQRTEAIASCMHLSHSLSKALACTGLPSYPIPPRRLYWTDVLACATLSALCEPVRTCVACPCRLLNFAVSAVLYRVTGTAPTLLEALLLSASCHCFGLLLQHAVESHYRRHFLASAVVSGASSAGAATAAATVTASGAGPAATDGSALVLLSSKTQQEDHFLPFAEGCGSIGSCDDGPDGDDGWHSMGCTDGGEDCDPAAGGAGVELVGALQLRRPQLASAPQVAHRRAGGAADGGVDGVAGGETARAASAPGPLGTSPHAFVLARPPRAHSPDREAWAEGPDLREPAGEDAMLVIGRRLGAPTWRWAPQEPEGGPAQGQGSEVPPQGGEWRAWPLQGRGGTGSSSAERSAAEPQGQLASLAAAIQENEPQPATPSQLQPASEPPSPPPASPHPVRLQQLPPSLVTQAVTMPPPSSSAVQSQPAASALTALSAQLPDVPMRLSPSECASVARPVQSVNPQVPVVADDASLPPPSQLLPSLLQSLHPARPKEQQERLRPWLAGMVESRGRLVDVSRERGHSESGRAAPDADRVAVPPFLPGEGSTQAISSTCAPPPTCDGDCPAFMAAGGSSASDLRASPLVASSRGTFGAAPGGGGAAAAAYGAGSLFAMSGIRGCLSNDTSCVGFAGADGHTAGGGAAPRDPRPAVVASTTGTSGIASSTASSAASGSGVGGAGSVGADGIVGSRVAVNSSTSSSSPSRSARVREARQLASRMGNWVASTFRRRSSFSRAGSTAGGSRKNSRSE